MHTVFCLKLNKKAPGLAAAPYPGELGAKIFANISLEAWQQWLKHQTLLINENRLSLADPRSRQFLAAEMEAFLFGSGSAKPDGYVPNDKYT
jgi:Fe-S cluster biosynthesis and repair protein YggX